MKKLTPFLLAIAFVVFLCGAVFSQEERPARPPRREVAPRMEEARKLMQRLRELNTDLREATAKARQNEKIQKAFDRVRKLQENLRNAQQKTREVLDKAIVKANPDLAKAAKQRREIEEKLRELRGRFTRRGMGVPGPGRRRPPRPRLPAESASSQEPTEAAVGTVVHFEIPADDVERAKKFYTELFAWKMERTPGPMEYWLISTTSEKGENAVGGIIQRQHPQQTITDYFAVPSIDDYTAKVEKLGGKVAVPKIAVPGMGYFAVCLDTENNAFAIWETNQRAK